MPETKWLVRSCQDITISHVWGERYKTRVSRKCEIHTRIKKTGNWKNLLTSLVSACAGLPNGLDSLGFFFFFFFFFSPNVPPNINFLEVQESLFAMTCGGTSAERHEAETCVTWIVHVAVRVCEQMWVEQDWSGFMEPAEAALAM